jgi:hypothetical protein
LKVESKERLNPVILATENVDSGYGVLIGRQSLTKVKSKTISVVSTDYRNGILYNANFDSGSALFSMSNNSLIGITNGERIIFSEYIKEILIVLQTP